MRFLKSVPFTILFLVLSASTSIAQGIITTYAGPALPRNGELAVSQAIDFPTSVVPDKAGGFYVATGHQNRVYRVDANGRIRLVAGGGTPGFSQDGSGGLSFANLGIAVDDTGNPYIADTNNNRIVKVTADGVAHAIAGNGAPGFSGDGGPATEAQLDFPNHVFIDSAGNLYIADSGNYRIRKVTRDGMISTVAGGGESGFSGDGGPATAAYLDLPTGVAVDSAGNLYIAESGTNRIRKVTPDGMISTVAGNGSSVYSGDGGPAIAAGLSAYAVSVDPAGNLYIPDYRNSRVRKITAAGVISTVAGNGTYGYSGDGGSATAAQLNDPQGLAVDSAGNLYFADYGNLRVRKVTAAGVISTVAGNGNIGPSGDGGPATAATLGLPTDVAAGYDGNLYIAEVIGRIRKVTVAGVISTIAGTVGTGFGGDGGPATEALLYYPSGMAIDSAGNLYIADSLNYRIRKITVAGIINTVAGNGIQGFSGDGGPATEAQLDQPYDVAVDSDGNLYIAEDYRIRKVTAEGVISTVAGNGTPDYRGDGGQATMTGMMPRGVAVDLEGNLYISDYFKNQIRKVTAAGTINTVAGKGITFGYSGDYGPATAAMLTNPNYLAVDSTGSLFITDNGNDRIRKVQFQNCSSLALSAGGAASCRTAGTNIALRTGYAMLTTDSGSAPYGIGVFSLWQNEAIIGEAGIPASPPTTRARIFIDFRKEVNAIPARNGAGIVDVNTGIALVNYGSDTAEVTYALTNVHGEPVTTGHGSIAAGKYFACFIDQLKEKAEAPDFNLPADFATAIQFGSLEITSTQPLSVLGLRGTMNQRNEFLMTTTPIADLTHAPDSNPIYFPQFVDGGGYTTSIILLNTSTISETGTLEITDGKGQPLGVNPVGGTADSSFAYSIPPGGVYRLQTDGFPVEVKAGWVRVTPDAGTSTPIGSGVFGYNPDKTMISESGVPSAVATAHARVYLDLSRNHNTGLCLANLVGSDAEIAIRAYQSDGITPVGDPRELISLDPNGYAAAFADQFITGLPAEFKGVLEISSEIPFAALTLRTLINERHEFLMTTFPVANVEAEAPSPIVFPQVVDGGGYMTEFILISPSGAASTTLSFYDGNGVPVDFGE